MSEDSAQGDHQAVYHAAAQSAAVPAAISHRSRPAISAAPTIVEETSHPEDGFHSPERHLGSQLREEGGATSPPMELFGAVLSPLEQSEIAAPIAQRTRAHINLMDVTLDELEAAFPAAEEPLLFFEMDDNAEYRRFLESLQEDMGGLSGGEGGDGDGGGGGLGGVETEFEDSDDEDFMVELERMLEQEETRQGGRPKSRVATKRGEKKAVTRMTRGNRKEGKRKVSDSSLMRRSSIFTFTFHLFVLLYALNS